MPASPLNPTFTLADVEAAAAAILRLHPDPVPAYRLLNEVLRLPPGDAELEMAGEGMRRSRWVQQLQVAQLEDGSWGRFHSQDTKVTSAFRTSEEAIDRAFALGLDLSHPLLERARHYIQQVLRGQARITDREEKAESWPLLIRFILAGRLAQLDPSDRALDEPWECLLDVARGAFASGHYSLENEARAFLSLTRIHVPNGFLESQHALWILSARPLPGELERRMVAWLWNKPDGIRYLRVPLAKPQDRRIAYWLRSMSILSRFPSWRQISLDLLNWLWEQRDEQGRWDFGRHISSCRDFPLSESWRPQLSRKIDYSTCLLVLLRRCFD